MSKLIINGSKPLSGTIPVYGMKNAATPIIAACLLIQEDCFLHNIPRITDVENMILLLKSLGANTEWVNESCLKINCSKVSLGNMDNNLMKSMRSSILLIGPLLARFKNVDIPEPGGCIIGNRPIDTHLEAMRELGAIIDKEENTYKINGQFVKGRTVVLHEFSVTATENMLMLAVLTPGKTILKMVAAEPHVQDLIAFLNASGAKIKGAGTHVLEIEGVEELRGVNHTIIPDTIEAASFIALAAATNSNLLIQNIVPEHMEMLLTKLRQININYVLNETSIEIKPTDELKAFNLQTLPYPGFPTDAQAPFGVLATQCKGASLIHDPMYEGRMGYLMELNKMGAQGIVADPHRIVISGPTPLYATEVKTLDLRAGITLVIAALIAKGETHIRNAEIIDRGYANIVERLKNIGAEIRREDN